MDLSHLLNLVNELPNNSTLNYVRGTDTCTFVEVDVNGKRINSQAPNGEPKSWAPSYLSDLAPKIKENVPFNLSGLLNNKGSYRPVLEAIIAHTREFYTVRKGTATALVWIPTKPKQNLILEEIQQADIPEPFPELDNAILLPPQELAEKVKEGFIKFWKLIDQHGVDFDKYIANFENAINPLLQTLGTEYGSIFQVVDYNLYSSILKRLSNEHPEIAYILNGRQNHGVRYEVGSTHVHYSNYLNILANSDFRQNIDKEQEELKKLRQMAHIDQPLQLIYYGAPGTGKSFTIDKATDEKNSVRTTFHPDSDYAGFVGAYKPTMECVPMSAFVGKEVHVAQPQGEHTGTERKIVYKYVPQAFLKAYIEAWKRYSENEDNPYYLVIEEINRGNCAQIFGDLFQLLDRNSVGSSSYAISADEDIAQFLRDDKNGFAGFSEEQKEVIRRFKLKKDSGSEEHIGPSILNGSKLLLPPNMRIWATMNTSDQSLFPIDSAFKRRWNWEYMPIEYDKKDWTFVIDGKRYSWGKFLEYINPKILELTQSEDKQMGYFFAKPDKKSNEDLQENDTISAKVFVNKVLFYLWTDVFKDYDLTQEPFVYEDKDKNNVKKAYRFTDFFPIDNSKKLLDFVEGMGLPIVDASTDEAENVDNEEENNNSGRTLDRYTLNGNGNFLMGPVAMQAMNIYISNNPEHAANDIVSEWSIFNRPKVFTAEQYEEKKSKSTDARIDQKHAKFDLAKGEAIYMSIGFIPDSMAEFIRILDTKDWGITIRKIDR